MFFSEHDTNGQISVNHIYIYIYIYIYILLFSLKQIMENMEVLSEEEENHLLGDRF